MCGWARYKIEYLKNWRRYVQTLAEAAGSVIPGSETYVFGGAAENRLTVLSDIDVLVIIDKYLTDREKRRVKKSILDEASRRGLPWDYPVEIHVVSREESKKYFKYSGKLIKIRA